MQIGERASINFSWCKCKPSFNHTCLPLPNCEPFPPTGGSPFSLLTLFKIPLLGITASVPTLKTFLLLYFSPQFPVHLIASFSRTPLPSLFSSYCLLIFNNSQAKLLAKLFPSLFLKHFLKSSLTFHSQSFNYWVFFPPSQFCW